MAMVPDYPTTLRTARLVLRPAKASDLDAFYDILSNPKVMTYWSTPPHPDMATTRAWLDRQLDPECLGRDFVIEREGRCIGKAGAWRLPEIGYILHPDAWGKGIAREAMEAIIPHLFATSDVPALTADVDPRHVASLALLDRLGFRETHRARDTFCIDGVWVDSIYLSLPRPTA